MPSGASNAEAVQAKWEARMDKKRKRAEIAEGPKTAEMQKQERLALARQKTEKLRLIREQGKRNAAERKAKETTSKEYFETIRIINKYLSHPKLEELLVDPSFRKTPKSTEEALEILSAIRETLSAHKGNQYVKMAVIGGAKLIEEYNPESMTNLCLTGFAEKVATEEHRIDIELAEAECTLGHKMAVPWWARLVGNFACMAKEHSDANKQRLQELRAL